MNRVFTVIWNTALGAWVVASEQARRGGKGAGGVLATTLLLPTLALAADLPSGGQVVSGSGAISTPTAKQMVIDQASNKLAIDWQSFDIAAGNKVSFQQPGRDAIALNRVLGSDGSQIMGQLDANGRVFLINPNGVLFGAGASVNVGGLVASTLDISNSDFEAGNYRFKGDGSNARVINKGQITAADGGSVALLGGTVSNNGVIVANQGTVALAAGNAVTLDFAGDGLLNVQVDEAVKDALVENQQLIQADGGNVILTASAADALLQTVVNNTGVIQARTLGEKDGKIVLLGDFGGGTVQVAGTLDASAPDGGNGGFIETSGAHVKVADNAKVTTKAADGKTGTWLIDPTDFTVSTGSASQTTSGIGASVQPVTLATVASGSEAGDINVNAAVSWSANTTLTMDAHGDINLNAAITASGDSAGLKLNHGGYTQNSGTVASGSDYQVKAPVTLSGSNASLSINGNDYTLIRSMAELDALDAAGTGVTGYYALAQDLDASGTTYNQALVGTSFANAFTGTFTGLGHTLSNLTIEAGGTSNVGLFGYASSGNLIRDIGLLNGSVTGLSYVGGLVGWHNGGVISNAYNTGSVGGVNIAITGAEIESSSVGGLVGLSTGRFDRVHASGDVTGTSTVGGLIGNSVGGSITNAYATGKVTGTRNLGGLVGVTSGTIDTAYANGGVTGSGDNIGGLVGVNSSGTSRINNAYATGSVTGHDNVGGLAGHNYGSLSNVYASGDVAGNDNLGGLVGTNASSAAAGSAAPILSAYATGNVMGNNSVGGLVGYNYKGGALSNVYASGRVAGNSAVGGLLGYNNGTAINGHWDTDSTSQGVEVEVQGNDSFVDAATIEGVNSSNRYISGYYAYFGTWSQVSDNVYVTTDSNGNGWIMIAGSTRPFLASEYSTSISNAHQLQLMAYDLGASYTLASDIDASATSGSNASGMWSTAGFSPVGNEPNPFTGSLDGNSRSVSDLTIKRTTHYAGLFGRSSGSISNLGLEGVSIEGFGLVGALAGANDGSINNVYATGRVLGMDSGIGGLTGVNRGTINNAYARSNVTGKYRVGGLVGFSNVDSRISNVYATGNVTSVVSEAGGLVGFNAGSITQAYATGNVTGAYDGGLVGYNNGSISASFWLSSVLSKGFGHQGGTVSANSRGLTAVEATTASTFTNAGWDIASTGGSNAIWRIYDGHSAPLLRSFLQSITLNADASGGSKTYDGTAATGTTTYTSSLGNALDSSKLLGSLGYTSTSQNAGTYSLADGTLILNGLYSDQQGYDISYTTSGDVSLTIDKAALTVTAADASKTYDGLAFSGGNGVSYNGFVNGENVDVLDGNLTYGGSAQGAVNAGLYDLNVSGLTSGNYAISYTAGSLNVGKAAATVTANSGTVTYNGQQQGITGFTASGLVNGETADVLSGVSTLGGSGINAGTYTHSARGTDGNYALTFVDGALTIDKAQATVTANSGQVTYNGQQQSIAGFTASGLVNGETTDVLSGVSTTGGAGINAGTYTHSAGGTDGNYALTFVDGALNIDKAQATVTANSGQVTYNGQEQSIAGFTASGLVNGETTDVLSGVSTTGGSGINAGTYTHSASGTDGNYSLTFVDGALTIDKADLAVTALDVSKTYDGLAFNGGNGVSYSGFVNGENADVLGGTLTYGGSAQGAVNAGLYDLNVSGLTSGNYAISYNAGSLNVDKVALSVTALDVSKTYDGLAFNGGNGVSYSGFVNGENADVLGGTLTYGGSAQGAVNAGLYDLSVSGLTSGNYAISYTAGSLTIAALPAEIPQPALTPAVGLRDAIASAQHTDNYANQAGDGESPELFTVVAGGLRVPQGL
ncbi:filamentous hemagglutinin family N-terminal domain-containing protein [Pseudomonas cuatrocienegasensis]|uniref:Filamentous hemagglutinin family N-terminal domain-containing protein n=1 Tax=Pseudomonas cuatrocienegasensis TaxID=543360 RepID=A0ABY1BJY3_9PSED|nr:MBG domain-containing protein [Pseudomonas cuatrocienegasensis]SER02284.1 filamentous hemagglutinin family N-terminal domain-containing protein [Pseudomonas cuatrocienegasensis]